MRLKCLKMANNEIENKSLNAKSKNLNMNL